MIYVQSKSYNILNFIHRGLNLIFSPHCDAIEGTLDQYGKLQKCRTIRFYVCSYFSSVPSNFRRRRVHFTFMLFLLHFSLIPRLGVFAFFVATDDEAAWSLCFPASKYSFSSFLEWHWNPFQCLCWLLFFLAARRWTRRLKAVHNDLTDSSHQS